MPRAVVFTTSALRDISQSHEWLTQPGSGRRSKAIAAKLIRAAKALAETADMYPQDRFFENSRQLVVDGYVIRYVIIGQQVSVERVYGPGQDRNS